MEKPQFASFEYYPARYTDYEAWVCIDGKWKKIDPADVFETGRPLTEANFVKLFGQVPALPKTAFHSAE